MGSLADKKLFNQSSAGTALSAFEYDIFTGVTTEDMKQRFPQETAHDSLRYIFTIFQLEFFWCTAKIS